MSELGKKVKLEESDKCSIGHIAQRPPNLIG